MAFNIQIKRVVLKWQWTWAQTWRATECSEWTSEGLAACASGEASFETLEEAEKAVESLIALGGEWDAEYRIVAPGAPPVVLNRKTPPRKAARASALKRPSC
jgi:hypothetical protein